MSHVPFPTGSWHPDLSFASALNALAFRIGLRHAFSLDHTKDAIDYTMSVPSALVCAAPRSSAMLIMIAFNSIVTGPLGICESKNSCGTVCTSHGIPFRPVHVRHQ